MGCNAVLNDGVAHNGTFCRAQFAVSGVRPIGQIILSAVPVLVRIIRVAAQKQAVCCAVHTKQNANAALKIADIGYIMETGRITLSGSGEELLSNDEMKRKVLGIFSDEIYNSLKEAE